MFGVRSVKVRSFEKGLHFRDREFKGFWDPDRRWVFDPLGKTRVDIVSQRDPWFTHADLDLIVRSGALKDQAIVLDLKDYERALVWIDGRLDRILGAGLYALWTRFRDVKVETVDARAVRFDHADLDIVLKARGAEAMFEEVPVSEGHVGIFFRNGEYVATLKPGRYAFWKGVQQARILTVNLRELSLDIAGQEIMTLDKVSLRLNAVMTYRVADPVMTVMVSEDVKQALYREAQLALRAAIGTRELDALLTGKDALAAELETILRAKAARFGLELVGLGIRDIVLPGDMKDLMNKVTEARKAAEANLIARREETAAMRNQVNTAKLLENNPTLMRLRELEVLEKVAGNSKLSVVLGEKGLADRVVNLL